MKQWIQQWKNDNRGIGVVEIILILVILVALVLIFKDQIMDIISATLGQIVEDSESIREVTLIPTNE